MRVDLRWFARLSAPDKPRGQTGARRDKCPARPRR